MDVNLTPFTAVIYYKPRSLSTTMYTTTYGRTD